MTQAGRHWQRTIFPGILVWRGTTADGSSIHLEQNELDTCVFSCSAQVSTPNGPREETLLLGIYVVDVFALSSHGDESFWFWSNAQTQVSTHWTQNNV